MQLIAGAIYWLLTAYFWVLIVRFALDLVISVNRAFRPRGIGLVLAELTMTITDPPLRLVRKIIKPIRIGSFGIDLAWTATLLVISFAMSIAGRFAFA